MVLECQKECSYADLALLKLDAVKVGYGFISSTAVSAAPGSTSRFFTQ